MMFSSDEENAEAETAVEVDLGNVVVVDSAGNPVVITSQAPQKSVSQSSRKSGRQVFHAVLLIRATMKLV